MEFLKKLSINRGVVSFSITTSYFQTREKIRERKGEKKEN